MIDLHNSLIQLSKTSMSDSAPTPTSMLLWFTCMLQPRKESTLKSRSAVLQISGKPTAVTVEDVPAHCLAKGEPDAAVLWQAESIFLERQEYFYPDHHVVAWEARHNDGAGKLLSRYRVLLSAHDN